MADIRCSNCGNNNPDFLDVCQFCQTPLQSASLHIGDEPTKKDTGELEEILPSWLKDARKQSKEDVGEDATLRSETRPKVQKNEAPDLLAGLISQADSDDDEVPDWLASINPVADKVPSKSSVKDDGPSDFFAQFSQSDTPAASEPIKEQPKQAEADWFSQQSPAEPETVAFTLSSEPAADDNSWMNNLGSSDEAAQPPAEKEPEDLSWLHDLESSAKQPDDFSAPQKGAGFDFASSSSGEDLGWLNDLGGASVPSFEQPAQPAASQPSSEEDLSWLNNLGGTSAPSFEQPAQSSSSSEDLSWLNNLGGASTPSFEQPSQPAASKPSSEEDLSWLNNLGGTSAPSFEQPAQSSSSSEDLSWLNNLGGTSAPSFDEPAQPAASQPSSSQEDMDWLKNLGETSSAPAFDEPVSSQSASSQEDLSWLDNLGGTPASSEAPTILPAGPIDSQEDLDWLSNLGGTPAMSDESAPSQPVSSSEDLNWLSNLGGTSTPAFEEPVAEGQQKPESSEPATSKPFQTAPLNEFLADNEIKDATPDWLKTAMDEPSMPALGDLSMDWLSGQNKQADAKPAGQFDESPASSQPTPASAQPAFDLPLDDSSTSDVDSLFNVEMPDWLSTESGSASTPQPTANASSGVEDESLAPVELPSWVQAMRPVASSIDEDITTGKLDQVTEREGPLAGFRGVIPASPIGSSLRPKAFSLKLQVSEEQQAGATLFEQILAGETTAQSLKSTSAVASQRMLRWALSGVFIVVLALVLGLGSKMMPIAAWSQLSDLVATVPDGSPVLVVMDYEPSVAGEMEATSGPLLDQLASSRGSTFNFISMSPNGLALVDRLMSNTKIATPQGEKYQLGTQYFNEGFLPGGSAGILGFIDSSEFEAVILMTDNAESGRVWIEQLEMAKRKDPAIDGKPLFVVSSAQSGPMLQPYVSSGQVDIVINGLYDAARYENMNTTRPGLARGYWDAFGIGLFMAIVAIILGSVWNVLMGIRERRAQAEQG